MKLFILLAFLITAALSQDNYYSKKPTKEGVAPVNNTLYIDECASCHFGYQPGLLPANAWEKMMGNLENHFGTDATLAQEDFVPLVNYLKQNSAEKNMHYKRSNRIVSSLRGQPVPDSISETPYMIEKHDEIRAELITQKEVKGIFNCTACHITADSGSYDDDDIRIPNYGRWED